MALRARAWHGAAERAIHRASAHRDREDAETAAALAETNRDGHPFYPNAFASSPSTWLRQKTRRENLAAMSMASKMPPQELRASLHGQIDRLSDSELEQAQRQLEVFELKRRLDELCDEAGEDWRAGRMTQEMVDEAIRKYRSSHPDRTRGHP